MPFESPDEASRMLPAMLVTLRWLELTTAGYPGAAYDPEQVGLIDMFPRTMASFFRTLAHRLCGVATVLDIIVEK